MRFSFVSKPTSTLYPLLGIVDTVAVAAAAVAHFTISPQFKCYELGMNFMQIVCTTSAAYCMYFYVNMHLNGCVCACYCVPCTCNWDDGVWCQCSGFVLFLFLFFSFSHSNTHILSLTPSLPVSLAPDGAFVMLADAIPDHSLCKMHMGLSVYANKRIWHFSQRRKREKKPKHAETF